MGVKIHLRPELEEMIKQNVQGGPCQTVDELVGHAISLPHEQEAWLPEHGTEIRAKSSEATEPCNTENRSIPASFVPGWMKGNVLGSLKSAKHERLSMLVSNRTRHLKFVVLLLVLSLAGCREDEAKSASAAVFNEISISVERLSDIHAATHICELAAAINLKSPSKSEECSSNPAAMAEELENEFLNTFQKNPACKGITLVVGTDDPARVATPEEQQRLAHAKYRLYFHLTVTNEGDVNWDNSNWQLERILGDRKPVHGAMRNLEKETTAFCAVVRGEGGSVR
ncbi:MAG TPA: hypothetical protein VF394_05780 [Candidatus Acidoferrum sp.]